MLPTRALEASLWEAVLPEEVLRLPDEPRGGVAGRDAAAAAHRRVGCRRGARWPARIRLGGAWGSGRGVRDRLVPTPELCRHGGGQDGNGLVKWDPCEQW